MGKCDAGSGVLFSACLPVSQSLWSDARCRDAGSRVVSPAACLPVCGQMPDAVTPAAGSCLPLVSLCLPDAVTLAPGSCLPLVSLCLPVSAVCRGRVSSLSPRVSQSPRSDARCYDAAPLVFLCLVVSAVRCQCDAGSGVVFPASSRRHSIWRLTAQKGDTEK